MRPLTYQYNRDIVSCHVVDNEGNRMCEFMGACFAVMALDDLLKVIRKENSKYLDFYLTDSASDKRKNKAKYEAFDLFMEKLSYTGLFRNVQIDKVTWKEINPTRAANFFNEQGKVSWLRLRWDIEKASGPEIFFVSNIIRTISLYPCVVEDFFRLLEKHPDVDPYTTFILAHKMRLSKNREIVYGHSVVSYGFKYVIATPKEILERLDNFYAEFKGFKSGKHGYASLRWDSWLVQQYNYEESQQYYRTGMLYSKELFIKSINKENYDGGTNE